MKPTDAGRDPAFDRLIARGLEKEIDASGNACPDADLLAAWFDRSLSAAETGRIEAHASSCAHCQQILADLARSEPVVTRAAPVPAPARPWHWHWRWLVPLATTAVLVVVATRTLRAPVEVGPTVPASRPAALGDRPATWVELQQRQAPPAPARERLAEPKKETARSGEQRERAFAEPVRPAAEPSEAPRGAAAEIAAPSAQFAATGAGAAEKAAADSAPLPPPAPARAGVAAKQAGFLRDSASLLRSTVASGSPNAGVTWRYGQGGIVERSADGGRTWERQQSGVTVALTDASAPSAVVCWIVGERGAVLRTTDGRTWRQLVPPTSADLVSVQAWSETNATVTASDRSEYETTDGGNSWRRLRIEN